MIRAVLVDDEPPARRKIRHLLKDATDFSVVGEAGSGGEAVSLLNRLRPDLVFLDISLPDCNAFDVLDGLDERVDLQVLFVTAYDEWAVKAFDRHAVDYLLKPIVPSRFRQSLERVRWLCAHDPARASTQQLGALTVTLQGTSRYARRLLIQEEARCVFLDVERIDWIEAARNYVCIHAGAQTYIQRSSLDALAAKLDPAVFRRINRSQIVSLCRVAEIRAWFHGDQKVLLRDGTELNWSRRYRAQSVEELERA